MSDQSYYWTSEWQEGEQESRKEIAAGRGITFKNAKDAIRWLKGDDSMTTNTPSKWVFS